MQENKHQWVTELGKLTKEQLGGVLFLNPKEITKVKKSDLISRIVADIDGNEEKVKSLYRMCSRAFALQPSAVEEMLGISRTERLRWTDEGKLNTVGRRSFRKWGKQIHYPIYDGYHTPRITEETVNTWRHEHKEKLKKARQQRSRQAG